MSEWHEGVAAIFDTLLAPRTEYRELLLDGVLLRAKVSIISIVRFNRLLRRHYQGYRVDHRNRGGPRHAVYTFIGDALRLVPGIRSTPNLPVPGELPLPR